MSTHEQESQERVEEEEAMRAPGFADPDRVREAIGLEEPRDPEPEGAPLPDEPDRGHPAPTPPPD